IGSTLQISRRVRRVKITGEARARGGAVKRAGSVNGHDACGISSCGTVVCAAAARGWIRVARGLRAGAPRGQGACLRTAVASWSRVAIRAHCVRVKKSNLHFREMQLSNCS
ncbi:MAG: hypothetical protein ACPIOQ_83025, partial [Promethearchaeia archaeon]